MAAGAPDFHEDALIAWNGATDHEDALRRVRADDPQVLHGGLPGTHVAGHLDALDHAAGVGAGADGTGGAGAVRLAVRLWAAAEAVPLHDAGETVALRRAGNVDDVAGLEDLAADLLADFPVADVVDA